MPGISGHEVYQRLRAAQATRDVPVVFLTGREDAKDRARGLELGANGYLTKPFEPNEVKAQARSLLATRQ